MAAASVGEVFLLQPGGVVGEGVIGEAGDEGAETGYAAADYCHVGFDC